MAQPGTQKRRRASTTGSSQPVAKRTQQDTLPADDPPLLPRPTIRIPPISRSYNLREGNNPNPANSAGLIMRTRGQIAAVAAAKKAAKVKEAIEKARVVGEQTQREEDGIMAVAKLLDQRQREDNDANSQVQKGMPSDDEEEFRPDTHTSVGEASPHRKTQDVPFDDGNVGGHNGNNTSDDDDEIQPPKHTTSLERRPRDVPRSLFDDEEIEDSEDLMEVDERIVRKEWAHINEVQELANESIEEWDDEDETTQVKPQVSTYFSSSSHEEALTILDFSPAQPRKRDSMQVNPASPNESGMMTQMRLRNGKRARKRLNQTER